MAARDPASVGTAKPGHFSARRILGAALACAMAASCSVSETSTQLGVAPAAYGSPPIDGIKLQSAASGESGQPLPASQPGEAAPTQLAEAAAGEQATTAAAKPAADANGEPLGQQQTPDAPAVAAEKPTETRKRTLFAGLFISAPAEAETSREGSQGNANSDAAGETAEPEAESVAEMKAAAAEDVAKPAEAEAAAPAGETKQEAGAAQASASAGEAAPQKRSFLSAFFAPSEPRVSFPDQKVEASAPAETEAAKPQAVAELVETAKPAAKEEPAKPTISLASTTSTAPARAAAFSADSLPGVRPGEQLFEIRLGSLTDDGDVDVYEQEEDYYQVASAAGLARLAPNGLLKQRESVEVACFKPKLVHMLKTIERRFGKRVIVTSGYRSPAHNRRVRGAPKSQHMNCAAADIVVEGVSKWEIAKFARSLPGRGGVGTYCHTSAIHVDVGPERDWNWRCGRRG